MKHNTIHYEQAIALSEQITREREEEQQHYLQEFKDSHCDLFDSADFHYYAEMTGKPISWIYANAKYADSDGKNGVLLENAMLDGDIDLIEELFT